MDHDDPHLLDGTCACTAECCTDEHGCCICEACIHEDGLHKSEGGQP